MRSVLIALLLVGLSLSPAQATTAPAADDPAVEARLVTLSAELRCLVCQNESLASSRAPLAEDLRREVREQISHGKSDQEIIGYLTDRYGDFVTYRPPWRGRTLLLWLGPLVLLALALGIFWRGLAMRSRTAPPATIASPDAEALARLQREFEEKQP